MVLSSECLPTVCKYLAAFKQFYVTWQKICGDTNGSIICNYITMSRQAWIWCRCWETRLDMWAIMWLTCVTVRVLKSRTSRDLSCDSSIYAYRLSLLPISYLWHHDDVTMISYASCMVTWPVSYLLLEGSVLYMEGTYLLYQSWQVMDISTVHGLCMSQTYKYLMVLDW